MCVLVAPLLCRSAVFTVPEDERVWIDTFIRILMYLMWKISSVLSCTYHIVVLGFLPGSRKIVLRVALLFGIKQWLPVVPNVCGKLTGIFPFCEAHIGRVQLDVVYSSCLVADAATVHGHVFCEGGCVPPWGLAKTVHCFGAAVPSMPSDFMLMGHELHLRALLLLLASCIAPGVMVTATNIV